MSSLFFKIFKILCNLYNNNNFFAFNRSRSITLYHSTYSQQKRCCSGYGPLPNCLLKIYVINVQNIIIWYKEKHSVLIILHYKKVSDRVTIIN